MDHNELTIAMAGALIGALFMGWILHWIYARLSSNFGPRSIKQTALLVERVHDAENDLREAEARLKGIESDLNQRIAQMQAELDAAYESLEAARDETEQIRMAYRDHRSDARA